MNTLRLAVARLLDFVDLAFDASAALYRAVMRGVLTSDAKSYRGSRFQRLAPGDVLLQEIELNAADVSEARRIVALDLERYLPLAEDNAAFDLAGPLDAEDAVRTRPERRFALGVVRRDTLTMRREEIPALRRQGIEAFAFAAPGQPNIGFAFRDAEGDRLRRRRRGLLALGVIALLYASFEAASAWQGALDRAVASAENERLLADRRVRQAESRLGEINTALADDSGQAPATLATTAERLALLARAVPVNAEISEVSWSEGALNFTGHAAQPEAAEQRFRQTFDGADLEFSAGLTDAPDRFDVSVRWAASSEAGAP